MCIHAYSRVDICRGHSDFTDITLEHLGQD